jgi:hypothetical protein
LFNSLFQTLCGLRIIASHSSFKTRLHSIYEVTIHTKKRERWKKRIEFIEKDKLTHSWFLFDYLCFCSLYRDWKKLYLMILISPYVRLHFSLLQLVSVMTLLWYLDSYQKLQTHFMKVITSIDFESDIERERSTHIYIQTCKKEYHTNMWFFDEQWLLNVSKKFLLSWLQWPVSSSLISPSQRMCYFVSFSHWFGFSNCFWVVLSLLSIHTFSLFLVFWYHLSQLTSHSFSLSRVRSLFSAKDPSFGWEIHFVMRSERKL